MKNPSVTDTKTQKQFKQEAKSNSGTLILIIIMAMTLSFAIAITLCYFSVMTPNIVTLTSGMKFKRVCYIGLNLSPYDTKMLGPNTRNVPDAKETPRTSGRYEPASTLRASMTKFNIFDASGEPIFDPKYCTHINVIPAQISANGSVTPFEPEDIEKYQSINSLRRFNPSLKILIAICGTNPDWGTVVSSNVTRKIFANNLVKFIQMYNFDGVDFDWEYPVYSSFKWNERNDFVSLLKDVRYALDGNISISENISDDRNIEYKNIANRKLLTIDVPGDVTIILPGYDVVSINSIVDWINIMTYDLRIYKPLYPFTGFNGALYPNKNQGYYFSTLNVASAAYLWHNLGMDKDKIVIGVPTYARSYVLWFPSLNYVGAPALREGNMYSFGDVCDILMKNGTVKVFDDEAKVPYAYNNDLWISYEDEESATHKAKWIRSNKFAGAMTFSLNSDDFDGRCDKVKRAGLMGDYSDENERHNYKFIIQRALYNVLK